MTTPITIVAEQAEDGGLWFIPATASEDYLQQALRRLHAAVDEQAKSTCDSQYCERLFTGHEKAQWDAMTPEERETSVERVCRMIGFVPK